MSQPIADFKYYIGADGQRTETAIFTSSKKNCPFSVTLEQIVDGVATSAFDARVIASYSQTESFSATDKSVVSVAVDHLITDFTLDTEGDPAARSFFRVTVCSTESTSGSAC